LGKESKKASQAVRFTRRETIIVEFFGGVTEYLLERILMRTVICMILLFVSAVCAEAAVKKNWYLRIDNGVGGEAYVFKSKAACEAGGQRMLKAQQQIDKLSKSYESKRRWSNPRCLDRLPYGYMPPP
jgi:hypothetical protein